MIAPLTSLRFFFAFAVFLSHYMMGGESLFAQGYIGVSFFFVLSGFILAYSYHDRFSQGGAHVVRDFYVARFARIYPLHLLTYGLALLLPLLAHSIPNWKVLLANLTLVQSWVPVESYYFSVNSPSWSISDEAFFYLVFPLLLAWIVRAPKRVNLLWAGALSAAYALFLVLLYDSSFAHAWFYVNPLFRVLDFALGIALYRLWRRYGTRWRSWGALRATLMELLALGLLVAMVVCAKALPSALTYACYYWLPMGAIIYLFAAQQNGVVSRILSFKWLVWGGEISFGFYMFHVPLMELTNTVWRKGAVWFGIEGLEWVQFFIVFVVILTASALSFKYYETPLNRRIKQAWSSNKL